MEIRISGNHVMRELGVLTIEIIVIGEESQEETIVETTECASYIIYANSSRWKCKLLTQIHCVPLHCKYIQLLNVSHFPL